MCSEVLLELVHVAPPDEAAYSTELVRLAVLSNGQRAIVVSEWLHITDRTR